MRNLAIILPEQISKNLSSIRNLDINNDILFFYEYINLNQKHHPKKIAFLLASMRRFKDNLLSQGWVVESLNLSEISNDFKSDIKNIATKYPNHQIIITEPSCYAELSDLKILSNMLNISLVEDDRFLSSKEFFQNWSEGKKQLRMEFFYREMRKKYNILLENGKPIGGKWNYDIENRKAPNVRLKFPKRISHKRNPILNDVLKYVGENFNDHFGDLEPFYYATSSDEAEIELDHFLENILPFFGEYQDAMVKDEPYLYHSLISSYLNNGLLDPLHVIKKAEKEYLLGKVPLNSVEGFIRQILGWREYIRGIYWLHMPQYKDMNFLNAKREIPKYYWGLETQMFCIQESVRHTKIHSYSHHIQRLMVTGNFGLLAGIDPNQLDNWYGEVYSDAFEWVHMPNTIGMSLFADGGIVASKPYAASGKYINKMSNYCKNCKYDPKETITHNACPFNSLYWNFIDTHKDKFENNLRMKFVYATWNKMSKEKRTDIISKANKILNSIESL